MTETGAQTVRPGATGRVVRELLAEAEALLGRAAAVREDHARAVDAVRGVLDPLLSALVDQELTAIPVTRLKDVTEGGCASPPSNRPGSPPSGRSTAPRATSCG